MLDKIEELVTVVDYALDSSRKRHVIGGALISLSLLFGGLAITAMTLKTEDSNDR